jgi:hypothetical protein
MITDVKSDEASLSSSSHHAPTWAGQAREVVIASFPGRAQALDCHCSGHWDLHLSRRNESDIKDRTEE